MVRSSKLADARNKRGWTQEEVAARLGIDVVTLHRWEHQKTMPRGYNRERLIALYEVDAWELGLEDANTPPTITTPGLPGTELLETRLLTCILQWSRNQLDYSELQRKLRHYLEVDMSTQESRRRVLELLASLPISVFGLSAQSVILAHPEEIMPWITGGITACWGLGRGNDLALATSLVSSYLPTLQAITERPRYRKVAASLMAQAYLLKARLGWHVSTLHDALIYAQEAEKYAHMAQDNILLADAMHCLGMVHYYSKQWDQALLKLEEAKQLTEPNHVPASVARQLYLDLATYQAKTGRTDETRKTLKKAQKYYGVSSDDSTASMIGYNIIDSLRWEGLAFSHLREYDEALVSYEQVAEHPTSIAKRIRVELLCNQLYSQLRRKDKDMEECISVWTDAVSGAKDLQSEQRFNEVQALFETMECVWPGETRIEALQPLMQHW